MLANALIIEWGVIGIAIHLLVHHNTIIRIGEIPQISGLYPVLAQDREISQDITWGNGIQGVPGQIQKLGKASRNNAELDIILLHLGESINIGGEISVSDGIIDSKIHRNI